MEGMPYTTIDYKTKIAIVKTNPTNKIKLFNSFSLYQMTILLNIFFIIFFLGNIYIIILKMKKQLVLQRKM